MEVRWCAGPEDPPLAGAVFIDDLYELACWSAKARLYVGNDSGITHLAAAVGTPVLALFCFENADSVVGEFAANLAGELATKQLAVHLFVREGYDSTLDEMRALRDDTRRVIAELQARYADITGVRSLKIKHNNVLGYFVDVTAQNGEKLMSSPFNATFIHRQTLAGQVRFTTTELGRQESGDG